MNIIDLDGIVIVTGTDTDAGKTVTTAVIAAALKQAGKDVLIIKPYQTGLAPEEPATSMKLVDSPVSTPTTCWSTCVAPSR